MKKLFHALITFTFFILAVISLNSIRPACHAVEEETYKPLAFTVHTQTTGPITVALGQMDVLTELNTPYTLPVTLSSTADTAISATLEFYSTDTVTPIEADNITDNITDNANKIQNIITRTVEIPAKGTLETSFGFMLLEGTYTAHYPLHVKCHFTPAGSDRKMETHAVRVVETKIVQKKVREAETVVKIGGVSLLGKKYTASRTLADKTISMPEFDGNDKESSCAFNQQNYETGGETRSCYGAHPPYRPYGGSFFAEYVVTLPNEPGLSMSYGACVRKVAPPEPPTDGVTFRFWAQAMNGMEKTSDRELLEEIHTTSTVWEDHTFSLEKYAGRKITLAVEIHPGPKNNTTCDGCYLSGLTINTARGEKLVTATKEQKAKTYLLKLDDKYTAQITEGANGLFDGKITILNPKKPASAVTFNGISCSVGAVSMTSSGAFYTKLPKLEKVGDKLVFTATLLANDEEMPIQMNVYAENGMLVFDVPRENPIQIRNFRFASTSEKAKRVYWGHGFVAENPGKFRIGMGGHDLAASFVGMDFENGTSLVQGASESPVAFHCDGERNVYTLEMSSYFRLALVPATGNAFNAAIKYRKNNTWLPKTAPGVERKRGRLVFDVWGGKYAQNVTEMKKAIQYGVTDSLFLKHVWQCWGYDVRLPDIWNTNPDAPNKVLAGLGTYEELKELAELCAEQGIPFGVHDNYIDFYPDAEEFSYDYIDFNADGNPRKAWINHGAGVQSYQWRPDLFKPFLLRNLELNRKYLPTMDAYFVDVFTSMNPYDYYGRDGIFHPKTQTDDCWKDCFETIAEGLSHSVDGKYEPAITTSEAGADNLLGSISGADCQWMLIDKERGGAWRRHVPCDDWARTPWFAAVNHTNYSRHGVGYPDRYNANREIALHSNESDDYMSAEMLGGVDLMVNAENIFRGSVHKHYLSQHVKRLLADKEIKSVEFVDGDIHRQCITWSNNMKIYVNRGETPWEIRGYTLPKYGYAVFCRLGKMHSAIACNPANPQEVVELANRPDGSFYMNGRGHTMMKVLPICPTMKNGKVLEDRRSFEVVTNWHCEEPTPKELALFAHVFEPKRGYGFTQMGWYDGYHTDIPTTQWGTTDNLRNIETGAGHIFYVPEGMRNGVYHVMVGLYDSKGDGRRYPLMGEAAQDVRYSVAAFELRNGKIVGELKPVPLSESFNDFRRVLGNKTPYTVNGVTTLGALNVKIDAEKNVMDILPLPPEKTFDVTLAPRAGRSVKSVLFDGQNVDFQKNSDGSVTFRVKVEEAKIYHVEF